MGATSFSQSGVINYAKYRSVLAGNEGFSPYPAFLDSAPLWLDASDATTITESGGSVSQWDNKGSLPNFTQPTGALQPTTGSTTLNGLNVLDFNDDSIFNSGASTDYSFMHNGTEYFFAIVVNFGAIGSEIPYVFANWNLDNVNNGVFLGYENRSGVGTDEFRFAIGAAGGSGFVTQIRDGNFFTSGFNSYSALLDPDNATAANRINYFRNTTEGTVTNTETRAPLTGAPRDNFTLGGGDPNFGNLVGSVAEFIVVSGADATEENRQVVVDYLNDKWSVF